MATGPSGQIVPNMAAPGTQITGQIETVEIGADGQASKGYKVMFVTAKGVSGSVFVPRAQYTPDNVRAAVIAHATQLDTVQGMQF